MKEKRKVKEVIEDIAYCLKIVFKNTPFIFVYRLICIIITVLAWLYCDVLLMSRLLDGIVRGAGWKELKQIIALGVILQTTIIILNQLYSTIFKVFYVEKNIVYIKKKVYKKILKIPVKYFYKKDFYNELSYALKNSSEHLLKVPDILLKSFSSLLILILSIYQIAQINKNLLVLVCAVTVIVIGIELFINLKLGAVTFENYERILPYERSKRYFSRIFYLKENFKEIKNSYIKDLLIKKFDNSIDEFDKIQRENNLRILPYKLAGGLAVNILVNGVLMFFSLISLIVYRNITLGEFWIVLSISNKIITSDFFMVYSRLYQQSFYIQKFKKFLNWEENKFGNLEADLKETKEIKIENLSYRYDGKQENTLNNINITIKPGQKIAIVGKNGSGKTTLLHLLMRLYKPTEGSILYDGIDTFEYKDDVYKELFSMVYQDYNIYDASVYHNVLLNNLKYRDNIHKVEFGLKQSDVLEEILNLPYGINSIMGKEFYEEGVELSKGQKQRVALARIFSQNNRVIILDEPTSSIDKYSENILKKNLDNLIKDKILIIVSHKLELIKDADYIYVLDRGEITEKGTHKELLDKKGKYFSMYNLNVQN